MSIQDLDRPAKISQFLGDHYVSNLMFLIWESRPDLQQAFDLTTEAGQQSFAQWYRASVRREYGLDSEVPAWSTKVKGAPADLREHWKSSLDAATVSLARARKHVAMRLSRLWDATEPPTDDRLGVNLIGYARAELGMGEHVRMSAASLARTDIPFGVINRDAGTPSRQQAKLGHGRYIRGSQYPTNLFHVNADQVFATYCRLGHAFFEQRRNILYPFWELAIWPEAWVSVLQMFDEIWAPTRFIQKAIAARTDLPVHYMPVSVTLPPLHHYGRAHFKLPESHFLFLFTFDFLSFLERKNPFGTIRAFKKAFPSNGRVGLVLKAMNGDTGSPQWKRMVELIDEDNRIFLLNVTMDREEVLDLYSVTDSFVSLHRSEGFGFGPAEAMYLGKPVIATNYSGNTDFTLADNSCLVDYKLIPVERGQYVHERGQVWADPDIDQAAWYMEKLVSDEPYRHEIAERGRHFVRRTYSPDVIGANYRARLHALGPL